MSEIKMVKPVVPMTEKEHDEEVNRVWHEDNDGANPFKTQQDVIDFYRNKLGMVLQRYFVEHVCYPDPMYMSDLYTYLFKLPDEKHAMRLNIRNGNRFEVLISKDDEGWEDPFLYFDFEDARKKMLELVALCGGNIKEDSGCEFCCDEEDILNKLSFCGKSLIKENLCLGDTPIADIEVYISGSEGLVLLVTNAADETIIHTSTPIKRCPMCGKELNIPNWEILGGK